MSIKKATPKAVFEACEQLELLGKTWNRDDVRMVIGGGSFVVIDPLIQAWRKLKPVREVAPTTPSELLIQVATQIEMHMSGFIKSVEQRDREREEALLSLNEESSNRFQLRESQLEAELELTQHANHELEAELSRTEGELSDTKQAMQNLELRRQVSNEAAASLKARLKEQKDFYESAIKELTQSHELDKKRIIEQHSLSINELKLDTQQQLAQQKSSLTEGAEIAENRLMRLLDQARSEQRQLTSELNEKIEFLSQGLQSEKQTNHGYKLEISSLTLALSEAKENLQAYKDEQAKTFELQIASLETENAELKEQLLQLENQEGAQAMLDIRQLRDSIKQLQDRVLGDA